MPASDGFRPLTSITAQWQFAGGKGLEHVTLEQHDNRISAIGSVVSTDDERPFGAWYHLFFDERWRIKAASIHRTDSRWFIANSREPGLWQDGDGYSLDRFKDCRDVELCLTAFSLTAMLRRLKLTEGETREHDVLALPLDTIVPARQRRRVTCLAPNTEYLVEDGAGDACQEITLDEDGLIVSSNSGFTRLT